MIDEGHGEDARYRLREQQGPAVKAEEPGAGGLDPEPKRGLVYRDVAGVEGDEEEVAPAGEHVLDARGVVGVAVPLTCQVIQVQECGQYENRCHNEPVP